MVFIGQGLEPKELAASFNDCRATPESLQARRASLRFAVGDEVECKTAQDEWSRGTVHSLLYRDDDLPQGVLAPYQVAPNPTLPLPLTLTLILTLTLTLTLTLSLTLSLTLTRWPWRTRVDLSGFLRTTMRSSDRGAGAPSGYVGAAVGRTTTSTSTRTNTVARLG